VADRSMNWIGIVLFGTLAAMLVFFVILAFYAER
jgi:hypothetical protein